MNEVIINGQGVSFEVANGQTFTTSLSIAQVFEKEHKNIIAQVRTLPQDKFTGLNFKLSEYQDSTGRKLPMYKISEKGFSILAMSFNGAKFYRYKVEFLEAFEYLKKQFAIGQKQFDQTLEALKEKSLEADTFRQKYYKSLEKQNTLLEKRLEDSALHLNALTSSFVRAKEEIDDLKSQVPQSDDEVVVVKKSHPLIRTGTGSPFRKDELQTALELHDKGVSYSAIGRALGRSASTISRNLRRYR